jgi:hypothetical protein
MTSYYHGKRCLVYKSSLFFWNTCSGWTEVVQYQDRAIETNTAKVLIDIFYSTLEELAVNLRSKRL